MENLKSYIDSGNLLKMNNQELIPYVNKAIYTDHNEQYKFHPLHYVCHAVFEGKIEESKGLAMVDLMLESGAFINGFQIWYSDSPLIAAISLYCEEIAFFLLDNGADLFHQGTHGGTALHWASWTGQDNIVKVLLEFPVDLEAKDIEWGATPLLWAIDGAYNGGILNQRNQLNCVKILLEAGSDRKVIDANGRNAIQYLKGKEDLGIHALFPEN